MKKNVSWITVVLLSVASGFVGSWIFNKANNSGIAFLRVAGDDIPVKMASNGMNLAGFEEASAISTPTVVFIKTLSTVQYESPFGFWDFDPFGSRGQATSTGSGVIVNSDGYIVTNNHVVQGGDKITVVLNNSKKEYVAKVVGTDPGSDLALIKIEEKNLPAVVFANSDDVKVGEWVLAVGNPFNLNSTVTAGIVSAKGRNINIVKNQFPIESFIQTDAAINPGNSGGALVDLKGQLVGINTAIQSNTGSYTGYGFAIPSNIVQKIVKDFIEKGEVQRAFSGMEIGEASSNEIETALIQRAKLAPEKAKQIAILSDGNYREALHLIQHSDQDYIGLIKDWLNAILKTGPLAQLKWVEEMNKMGREQQKQFLKYFNHLLEHSIRLKTMGTDLPLDSDLKDFALRINKIAGVSQMESIVNELDKAIYYIERNANAKMLFMALSIKLYHIIQNKTLILTEA